MAASNDDIFGLFFEVMPKPGHEPHYFDHVEELKPALARHHGLLWLQRYKGVDDAGLILSHQLWDSETALADWRRDRDHRQSQIAGMTKHFADYRIRVGQRLWHLENGVEHGHFSADDTAKPVLAIHGAAARDASAFAGLGIVQRRFVSVLEPATALLLISFDSVDDAVRRMIMRPGVDMAAFFAVTRDYGLFDRTEAPRAD